ncbi:hypothetical protein K502DRAFT_204666 [Neoconidiobolus thromboides FSU 785]|nr:hypothetical protein K502DRAFT_204666 [Neoconidiobolus thromboides FSU 785]
MRYYDLVLCFIFLFFNINKHNKRIVKTLLEWICDYHFEGIVNLIIAVREHNNCDPSLKENYELAIRAYISNVVGFPVILDKEALTTMHFMFNYSEKLNNFILYSRLTELNSRNYKFITKDLTSEEILYKLGNYLEFGLKAISLKEFINYEKDIKNWISELIININHHPIHFKLPNLIKAYVSLLFTAMGRKVKKIDEELLTEYLKPRITNCLSSISSKNILFFYYLLLFNAKLLRCCDSNPELVSNCKLIIFYYIPSSYCYYHILLLLLSPY